MLDHLPAALRRWFCGFLLTPLIRAEEAARAHALAPARNERKVVFLLLYTAVALTVQHYFCRASEIERSLGLFRALGWKVHFPFPPGSLAASVWWAGGSVLLYLIVPALIVRLVFHERLADYGLKLRGAFVDGWVYVVFLSIVGPLVVVMSAERHFQAVYPFYHPREGRLGVDFWVWEGCYALQFVGLEFFFRGLLIHGLKQRFGALCIPVMTIPYCMLHFNKPLPETLASILAGFALGFMSLRTGSIALGAVLHIQVALGMDLASLWRQGLLAPGG